MNLLKLLQTIEELVYEVALLVVLIPKTFLRILTGPGWFRHYIVEEFEKSPSERFDGYVSPVLFWIIAGITPFLIFRETLLPAWWIFIIDGFASLFTSGHFMPQNNLQQGYQSLPHEHRFIGLAVYYLISPIVYSVVIQRARKRPIARTSMKRVFYIQCSYFALLHFSLIICNLLFVIFIDNIKPMPYMIAFGIIGTLAFTWFLYAETVVFSQELGITRKRTIIWYVALCFILSLLVRLVLSVLLVVLINISHHLPKIPPAHQ